MNIGRPSSDSLETKLLVSDHDGSEFKPVPKSTSCWTDVKFYLQLILNPSFKLSICLLTVVCGLMDAAAFIGLGGIFTNIQTGNIIQLAFIIGYASSGRVADSSDRVGALMLSLGSFIMGAAIGGCCLTGSLSKIKFKYMKAKRIGFLIEWVLLLGSVICAAIYDARNLEQSRNISIIYYKPELWACVFFTASAMGVQAAMVRVYNQVDFATNLMTLTTVSLVADSKLWGGPNTRWHRRLGSIIFFFVSVVAGSALSLLRTGPLWPLFADFVLFSYILRSILMGTPPAPAPASGGGGVPMSPQITPIVRTATEVSLAPPAARTLEGGTSP